MFPFACDFSFFFLHIRFFPNFAPALNHRRWFKQNLLTKAFSGRFGFDSLELRKLKRSVKNKATGTPHVMIIHFRIYHLAWGFQRCSLRLTGQCEGLNEWNGHQNWLHVFFFLIFMVREPTAFWIEIQIQTCSK